MKNPNHKAYAYTKHNPKTGWWDVFIVEWDARNEQATKTERRMSDTPREDWARAEVDNWNRSLWS